MGTYTVTLSASDDDGGIATPKTITVTVESVPPTATILGLPASSPEGTPISLSSSVAAPGVLDRVAWHVDAGNGQAIPDGATTDFSFTPSSARTYIVTLTAYDKNGDSTDSQQVLTITDVAPNVMICGAPPSVAEGTLVNLTSNTIDPGLAGGETIQNYQWTVSRNGQPYILPRGTATNLPTFSFLPQYAGNYHIGLAVQDSLGLGSNLPAPISPSPTRAQRSDDQRPVR